MQPQASDVQLGLETLTICPKKSQTEKHCNSCMFASSDDVVSSSSSSLIGDYIGMESCFDLDRTEANTVGDGDFSGVCNHEISRGERERRCRRVKREREFPPPIPSLARTENLYSHMPWVLKRYYTDDGRLILREEKVKHHEYFRAHRSNGRLTLHLVPWDDDDDDYDNDDHAVKGIEGHQETDLEKEEEKERKEEEPQINNADDDYDDKSHIVAEIEENGSGVIKCSSVAENPSDAISAANAGKLLNYSSVRTSATCFLSMPVPAIRPVHT